MAQNVKAGPAKSVEGQSFVVTVNAGKVMVDNALVTQTDIVADNGVIHVIDTVIVPE